MTTRRAEREAGTQGRASRTRLPAILAILAVWLTVTACGSTSAVKSDEANGADADAGSTGSTSAEAAADSSDTMATDEPERPAIRLSGATEGPVRLTLDVRSEPVKLGDPIEVEVTVINESDAPVRIREIVHDRQSVTFGIVWNRDTQFEFEKIVTWSGLPRQWEVMDLAPGERAAETFRIPTLVGGPMQIAARFHGAPDGTLRSDPVTIDVPAPAGKELHARLDTNFGDFAIRFYADDAPNTCLHFLELVDKGFYERTGFHRLIAGFVLQGGDPNGNGSGDAGYDLPAEFNERLHRATVLSMARAESPDSAGSQFFVCLGEAPHLDGAYTAFGEVVDGFDRTVRKIELEAELYDDSDRIYDDVSIQATKVEIGDAPVGKP